MIRKAFILEVFPECIAEYEKRHNPISQDLINVFERHKVREYSIFYDAETNFLFGYVEVENEANWEAIARTDACQRWWSYMRPLMRYNNDGTPWSRDLREVFHLD